MARSKNRAITVTPGTTAKKKSATPAPARKPATESAASALRFRLYEEAVQSPEWQMRHLPLFHKRLTGAPALAMREDFCGTGRISCEWAKKSPKHRAVGLDIDGETLAYARDVNRAALSPVARERVAFLKQDVRQPTREKFDVIGAHNFSFYVFHERADLLRYARAARASLKPRGTFFLEMIGGEGFLAPASSAQTIPVPGVGKVRYVWEQHQHDPLRELNDYSIHFQLPGGRWINDAFTYHWRTWTIREVREVLREAGFRETVVYWQGEDEGGEGTGEYRRQDEAEHAETWLAYVVGVK